MGDNLGGRTVNCEFEEQPGSNNKVDHRMKSDIAQLMSRCTEGMAGFHFRPGNVMVRNAMG